jgi:hypothetical protein
MFQDVLVVVVVVGLFRERLLSFPAVAEAAAAVLDIALQTKQLQ